MSVENVCSNCDAEYDTRIGHCPACGYKERTRAQRDGGSSLERVVSPQPGEVWEHYRHGKVKIIQPWNERESVCEAQGGRRMPLMNELMTKTEAFWVEG